MKAGWLLALVLGLGLGGCAADAQDMFEDASLIHADVPLWTEDERIWPRHFADKQSFGCAHVIQTGDWELVRSDHPPLGEWIRLSNYGAVHCFIVERRGFDQAALGRAGYEYSVLVDLGTTRGRRGEVRLWALQSGTVPGSDYLLLATAAKAKGPIREFQVLRRRCPEGLLRGGPQLDILLTRYCAINTQDELIALARKMADLPPLGTLVYRGPAPDDDEHDDE